MVHNLFIRYFSSTLVEYQNNNLFFFVFSFVLLVTFLGSVFVEWIRRTIFSKVENILFDCIECRLLNYRWYQKLYNYKCLFLE